MNISFNFWSENRPTNASWNLIESAVLERFVRSFYDYVRDVDVLFDEQLNSMKNNEREKIGEKILTEYRGDHLPS